MNEIVWNPWHGCTKISTGCQHCYVYRLDSMYGRNPQECKITGSFDLPIKRNRRGEYKIPSGSTVLICFSSDFLIDEADSFRKEAWDIMRTRKDLVFLFITKRIDRLLKQLPSDWGLGWDNVVVVSTCEDQANADFRIPIFLNLPLKHRGLCLEPLIEYIDLRSYLSTGKIDHVICGGESGSGARICKYSWVEKIAEECRFYNVPFCFKQTGARFADRFGTVHKVNRSRQFILASSSEFNTYSLDEYSNLVARDYFKAQ